MLKLGQHKSLQQDLISKNHKSKREAHFIDLRLTLSLLTSDSWPKYVGVLAEAALT